MIAFNVPPYVKSAKEYIEDAYVNNHKICGDGPYTKKVSQWFEERLDTKKVLLTTSCSHALDMMGILAGIEAGDEVILPSYNFVSSANAVAMRGGKCVFVDIRPDTMNIDENKIELTITDRTKAIIVVHYAGVSCEMDAIMRIADKHGLLVLEDAAQGMMSTYKGRTLGTIGQMGAYSFHETKNYSMGEGGLLLLNDPNYIELAEMLREKGTDRSKFWRGQVDKYTWQMIGSSYLPSEINAAYLYAQLEVADEINADRLKSYNLYKSLLAPLENEGIIELPHVPDGCVHNGHMFYIKCKDLKTRQNFISYMKLKEILCVFHYVPLHSSPAGLKYGRFSGKDEYTTRESERLVRLPMYWGLEEE
ncbi:MAG: dTDP-4-amino-4,6-dideoxygalactose transaminase, partial [Eubacteriales bacterium]